MAKLLPQLIKKSRIDEVLEKLIERRGWHPDAADLKIIESMRGYRGRKDKWLEAFRETGSVKTACENAKVPKGTYYKWRVQDPWFCLDFNKVVRELYRKVGKDPEKDSGWIEE